MKKIFSIIAALFAATAALAVNIVPTPVAYEPTGETAALPSPISVGGYCADKAASQLAMRGIKARSGKELPWLAIKQDTAIAHEGYSLEIGAKGAILEAADSAGVFYGIETLTQLIDQSPEGKIAQCQISDYPRMDYRGMMLDVVRCYLPIEEVKKLVDVASQLKLNKLHLHLTDDNGWRMEIKQYPKLTEVGAWRVDRPELFPGRANPKEGEPATYGGFYTQDELRDLVEYAAERQITVIPEIEMPAHAIAAIASYPQLACPVVDEFVGVLPGIGGPAASIIMCAGKDGTLEFVRNVLDEVMEVFPSEYIHLGGDEANKEHWKECELCNKRMAEEGLADYEALQGWFMDQINSYVRSKGRTAMGWDEVTYGNPKEDMVIMGWQGDGGVAVRYADRTGSRFVMTPALSTYFIRYQGPQWFEPFTYFGNITLKDVYDFDPVKEDWSDALAQQMWGIQGSMWTEFCRTPADVQYMLYPRMIALADAAWRECGTSDWSGFVKGVDAFLPRLEEAGINYARSMYNIQHKAVPNGDGTITLSAECIRPDAVIVQTAEERVFANPTRIYEPTRIGLQAFTPSTQGQPLTLDFKFNAATGYSVQSPNCNNGLQQVLTNGLRGSTRNSDFEWAGWHNRPAEFTIDLGRPLDVYEVKLGALANANMNVALPKTVTLYAAGNDEIFFQIKTIDTKEVDRFPLEPKVTDLYLGNLDAKNVRYLRVVAENAGPVPAGYPREGSATWICFDEIDVTAMPEMPAVTNRQILYDHGDMGSTFWRIPALATTNSGVVVAVADKRNDSNRDLPNKIDLAVRRSFDSGQTWTEPVVIIPADEGGGYGDASLGVHRPSGNLVLVAAHGNGLWESTPDDHAHIIMSRSSDDGATWSKPVDITASLFDPVEGVAPVQALTAFASSGAMLCDDQGRLAFVLVANCTDQLWGPLTCFLCYSDDGGDTWHINPTPLDEYGDESKVTQLSDGSYYLSVRNRNKGAGRHVARSTDRGETWTAALPESQLIDPACNGDLINISPSQLKQMGIADILGEEAVAQGMMLHSLANDPKERRNVTILYSLDRGITWDKLITVAPGRSVYSALAVLPDGTLGCLTEEDCELGGLRLWFNKIDLKQLLK